MLGLLNWTCPSFRPHQRAGPWRRPSRRANVAAAGQRPQREPRRQPTGEPDTSEIHRPLHPRRACHMFRDACGQARRLVKARLERPLGRKRHGARRESFVAYGIDISISLILFPFKIFLICQKPLMLGACITNKSQGKNKQRAGDVLLGLMHIRNPRQACHACLSHLIVAVPLLLAMVSVAQHFDDLRKEGNACFQNGDWTGAMHFYGIGMGDLLTDPCVDATAARSLLETFNSNVAQCLLKQNRFMEAAVAAGRCLLLNPTHSKALYRRAVANEGMGHVFAAQLDLEQLLQQEPNHEEALTALRRIKNSLALTSATLCPQFVGVMKALTADPMVAAHAKQLATGYITFGDAATARAVAQLPAGFIRSPQVGGVPGWVAPLPGNPPMRGGSMAPAPTAWAEGLSKTHQQEWLVDCYRLRLETDQVQGQVQEGLYHPKRTPWTMIKHFLVFCKLAVVPGAIPTGWDWPAFLQTAGNLLPEALCPGVFQERYAPQNDQVRVQVILIFVSTAITIYGTEVAQRGQTPLHKKMVDLIEPMKLENVSKMAEVFQDVGGVEPWLKLFETLKTKPNCHGESVVKLAAKPSRKREGKPAAKPAAKPSAKPAAKPAAKPVAKPPAANPAKPEAKPAAAPSAAGLKDEVPEASAWAEGLNKREQLVWLVDCYRMRLDDDYVHGGGYLHGLYDPGHSPWSIMHDFLVFCKLAVSFSAVPSSWDWSEFLHAACDLLPFVFEKADAQKKYGTENVFQAMMGGRSLRFTGELIYSTSVQDPNLIPKHKEMLKLVKESVPRRANESSFKKAAEIFKEVGGFESWLKLLEALKTKPSCHGESEDVWDSADEGSEASRAESTPAADVSTHDVTTASPGTAFGEEEVDDTLAVGELKPLQDLREGLRKWIASCPNFKRSERLASNELEEGDELHWKYENDEKNTNYFKFAEVRAQSGSLPPPEAYQVEQEGLCPLYGSNLWPVDASARLKQLWRDLVQPMFKGSSCKCPQLVLGEQRDGGQDACLKLLAIAWAEEVQVVGLDFDPTYEEGCISCGGANPEIVSLELEGESHGELIESLTKKLLEQCSWQEAWQLDPSKGEAYMEKVYMKSEDTASSKKKPKKKGKKV